MPPRPGLCQSLWPRLLSHSVRAADGGVGVVAEDTVDAEIVVEGELLRQVAGGSGVTANKEAEEGAHAQRFIAVMSQRHWLR